MNSCVSIWKKCIINKLVLPFDIIDNIKSFIFYDKKSYQTILFIREKKRQLCQMYKHDIISYFSFIDFYTNPALVKTWYITFDKMINNHLITFIMEGNMCSCCGNYVKSNNEFLPISVRCKCVGYIMM